MQSLERTRRAQDCAASGDQRKRVCINDLPNEMLYEIFRHLDQNRPRYFPLYKRRLNIYDTMMCVSRRWKAIAMPFLWHFIVHQDVINFWDQWRIRPNGIDDFDPSGTTRPLLDWGDRQTATLVRHLRVGPLERMAQGYHCDVEGMINLPTAADMFPFRNLLTLENVACITIQKFLRILAVACPRLEELAIIWGAHQEFLDAELLQGIHVLRIFVTAKTYFTLREQLPSSHTFNTITNLQIRNCRGPETIRDHIGLCCSMSFPRLQVLRFEAITTGAPDISDFIHRYPSLSEVSLDFDPSPETALRLEALVKLINGTGIWKRSPDTFGVLLDQPSFREFTPDMPIPPNFDMAYGIFWRVAFRRVTLPGSSEGPDNPKYKCTGFAVDFFEIEDDEFFDDLNYDLRDALDFVHDIKTEGKALVCFEDVEELNLKCGSFAGGDIGFAETMNLLGDGLRQLRKLRRLAINFSALRNSAWTSGSLKLNDNWKDPEVTAQAERESSAIPFMDEVCPPAFGWSLVRPCTLDVLHAMKYPVESIIGAVHEVLRLDPDEPLDEEDASLLLGAWEARNHTKMESIVARLARACPTLESFEWWVLDGNPPDGILHWGWKIDRPPLTPHDRHADEMEHHDEGMDGGRYSGPLKLRGNLTWTGCVKGTPPEFPVLVGEELEYQYGHAWGRSLPI